MYLYSVKEQNSRTNLPLCKSPKSAFFKYILCVTLGNTLKLSEPYLLHVKNRNDIRTTSDDC